MTIITVGIDPGKSCGLAVLKDGRRLGAWQGKSDMCMNELTVVLAEYARWADVEIGIERFTVTNQTGRKSQQSDALEITGQVELIAGRYQVLVVRQIISDVKRFVPNERLRKLGLWVKANEVQANDADDANDAMRHAVYRFAMRHASLFALRLKGI